jgi:predicted enzyme related to lactoylglutathione lyase
MTNTRNAPDHTTTTTPGTGTKAPDAVTWFEVHTPDVARAEQFYGTAFGWRFENAIPGYTMVQLGDGAPISGGIAATEGARPAGALFMIQVDDVAAALDAVRDAGGSVVADAQSTPTGLAFGYAADPDGSVFGVWCPPPAA